MLLDLFFSIIDYDPKKLILPSSDIDWDIDECVEQESQSAYCCFVCKAILSTYDQHLKAV